LNSSKNLDTLVADIYESLTPLCDNEGIDIPDEAIDKLCENIKVVFKQWQNPPERNKNFTLRMSNIGKPSRQLWYEKKLPKGKEKITPSTFIKFMYGHLLEEVLLFLVSIAGHKIEAAQKEVLVNGIKGHMDCKIDGEVIDIKTASGRAFQKFSNDTLAQDDPFGYIAQLCGYEEAEGTDNGGFLVINKETGELTLHRPEELDKINVVDKIDHLKHEMSLDTPPEKCYSTVPEGKSGNMKLNKGCFYCSYKFECHADANDGDGLRVFRYSKGPTYLTTVKVEPRVEEVI
jgi:hypothetical protein|tara:strand:- start:1977 stop:2843 length:867 start_codon:yes stop_codon:yes gene_type:complete